MTEILDVRRPELHELVALSAPECKEIPVVTPSVKIMEKLGVWIFRDKADGRLWMGLRNELAHREDRWLYRSTLPGEPESRVAFWYGLGNAHAQRAWVAEAGDIDPYLALQTFNSNAVNTNRMIEMMGSPKRDYAWLMSFSQLSGSLGIKSITHLPEQVNWGLLHELVWHLDTWRAANDAVDMPLDLILRMCGFHDLAEAGVTTNPEIGFIWKRQGLD